jgi:hypothetical protein
MTMDVRLRFEGASILQPDVLRVVLARSEGYHKESIIHCRQCIIFMKADRGIRASDHSGPIFFSPLQEA